MHAHNTRQTDELHITSHNTNARDFINEVYGVKLANDLNSSYDLINNVKHLVFLKDNIKHS